MYVFFFFFFFFFNDTATTEIYTLSLHDALPISVRPGRRTRLPQLALGARPRRSLACSEGSDRRLESRPSSGGRPDLARPASVPARGVTATGHHPMLALSARCLCQRSQLLQGAAQQTRHLHLGDANALGDLSLGEIVDEAHMQYQALAWRDVPKHRRHGRIQLDQFKTLVVLAHCVAVGDEVAVGTRSRGVQRQRFVGLQGLQCVDHVLRVQLQILRKLVDRWRASALVGESLPCVAYLQRALLRTTGHVHGPSRVTEVAAHLTEDRRYRKRRKGVATIRVVAIQSLQQAQRRHLQQILKRLGGAAVAPCQAARERHEAMYEHIARTRIAVTLPAQKQLPRVVLRAGNGTQRRLGGSSHGGHADSFPYREDCKAEV